MISVADGMQAHPASVNCTPWARSIYRHNGSTFSVTLLSRRSAIVSQQFSWTFGGQISTRAPSGLFRRRCPCGLELSLSPLHALVVTAFYLAQSGLPGETLFGMLACLVCLLNFRADPLLAVDVSVDSLITSGRTTDCRHQRLNAAQLAQCVPQYLIEYFKRDVQLGWSTFVGILLHAVKSQPEILQNQARFPACDYDNHDEEDKNSFLLVRCRDV